MNKIDPDKLREYVRRHPGTTQRQIAEHFDCNQTYISATLKKHSIPYTKNYDKKIDANKLRELEKLVHKNPFQSFGQIAQSAGISSNFTYYVMRRYGINRKRERRQAEVIKEYLLARPGIHNSALARRFGIDRQTMRRKLEKYGIEI